MILPVLIRPQMAAAPRTEVEVIIDAFKANLIVSVAAGGKGADEDQVFTNADQESWNPWTGQYTRNVGWTYQSCD